MKASEELQRNCWVGQVEEEAYLRPRDPTLVCPVHQRTNSQPQLFLFVALPQRHRLDARTGTKCALL